MKRNTLRFAAYALLPVGLVTLGALLAVATATDILFRRPTTLVGVFALRAPVSGCATPAEVASTGTLKVTLRSDRQRHLRVEVEGAYVTGTTGDPSQGRLPVSMTARPFVEVDNRALYDRPVNRSRFGMVVVRVNLLC